jgi:hypothetical protein
MGTIKDQIKEKLINFISQVESIFSKAKFSTKDRLHLLEPIKIMPYYGFGNDTYIYLKGRVIENEG